MDIGLSKITGIDFNLQIEVLRTFANKEGEEKKRLFYSLMFLAADIIKADGVIKFKEIQQVKDMLCHILKEDEVKVFFAILQESLNAKESTYELNWQDDLTTHCNNLKEAIPEEGLIHVLAFLHDLIKVDGVVDACEMVSLMGIAQLLGVNLR